MNIGMKVNIKLPTDLLISTRGDYKYTIATIKDILAMIVNVGKKKEGILRLLCLIGKNKHDLRRWCLNNNVKYNEEYEYDIRDILLTLSELVVTIGKYKYPSKLGSERGIEKTLNKVTDLLIVNDTMDRKYGSVIIAMLEQIALDVCGMVNLQYNKKRNGIELCWISKSNEFITDYFIAPNEDGNVDEANANFMRAMSLSRHLTKLKTLATEKNDIVIERLLTDTDNVINRVLVDIIGNAANEGYHGKELRGLHNLSKGFDWLILYPHSRVNYESYLKLLLKNKDVSEDSRKVYDTVATELMEYLSMLTYDIYYRMDGVKISLWINDIWKSSIDIDYEEMK